MAETITEEDFYEVDTSVPFYSTGCKPLDLIIGGGLGEGYPAGKIACLGGEESSGKTGSIWETIVYNFRECEFKKIPFRWRFCDAEHGSTHDVRYLYGMDDEEFARFNECGEIIYLQLIEEIHLDVRNFLDTIEEGTRAIYVLDSMDATKSLADDKHIEEVLSSVEKGKDPKGTYGGGKQQYLSRSFFKGLVEPIEKKKAIFLYTKQARYNFNGMTKYSFGGGKASDHYNDIFIVFSPTKKIEKTTQGRKVVVGNGVKAQVKKNKSPRPYGIVFYDIYFSYGIDLVGCAIDYIYALRTESGAVSSRSKVVWDGEQITREALMKKIEEKGLYRELNDMVRETYEKIYDAIENSHARPDKKKMFIE